MSAFRKHPIFFLMIAGAFLYFFRLGSTDLQEWDEIYYSSRALTAAFNHQWLDQSDAAIGGLWTSSHPPLVIWAMASFVKIAGASEAAFRAAAALAGLGCLWLLYLMAVRLSGDRNLAAICASLLLLTPYFTRYARMAQLDIPLIFLILLCLYFFRLGLTGSWRNFLISGAALGLGLMSKIAVALICLLIILLFLIWEFASGSRRLAVRALFGLAVISALGLAVAFPWHMMITDKLGMAYWRQSWGYHVFQRMSRALEGHDSALGIFFWPFQAVVRLGPFFPFALVGMKRSLTLA